MAAKNFRSTLLEPTSEFAQGDKLRFTALSTSGSVFNSSFSEVTIGDNGQYSVDLQYGKYRIDYKPYDGCWQKFADVEVSASTLATSLQALALSSKQVTDDTILMLQSLLADAESANANAQAAKAAAEAAMSAAQAAKEAAEAAASANYAVAFEHYVSLPAKLTVYPLGLTDAQIDSYEYDSAEKYTPINSDGAICYIDVPEFNFLFNNSRVYENTEAHIVFFANVGSSADTKSTAKINMLRYNPAYASFQRVLNNGSGGLIEVSARNWGDNYVDRSEFAVAYDVNTFGAGAGNLRIINLGAEILEVFGLGVVIKKVAA